MAASGRSFFFCVQVNIKSDIDRVTASFSGKLQGQIPYAASRAMNATIDIARDEIVKDMRSVFDRPTPYALNGLRTVKTNKRELKVSVAFKDEAGKGGTPADKFVAPQVFGGNRRLKRFERALQRIGAMPSGSFAVPGAGAVIDSYGNMARSQITQILSALQAFGEQGYLANATAKTLSKRKKGTRSKRGEVYFALPRGRNGLKPGVYKRTKFAFGWALKPVLIFVTSVGYSKRLPMLETVRKTFDKHFASQFEAAFVKAVATAR